MKKKKRHNAEAIAKILRLADGPQTIEEVCREENISEQTFYRWKRKYRGMDLAEIKRLKTLEKENTELKKMLADTLLENRALRAVNEKKW